MLITVGYTGQGKHRRPIKQDLGHGSATGSLRNSAGGPIDPVFAPNIQRGVGSIRPKAIDTHHRTPEQRAKLSKAKREWWARRKVQNA